MVNNANVRNIEIENAHIMFRNFSGKEARFNRAGDRNFCVVIDDPEQAQELSEEGWNVRILRPREEGDDPRHYITVSVNFNFWKKPEIYMVSRNGKVLLDEESVAALDYADISNVDLVIRPRKWDDNGITKIKAYLQEMYVTVQQSRFAEKYASEEYPVEDGNLPF